MNSKPTVNLAELRAFDEAHAHARGFASDLAGEALRAGPIGKTPLIFARFRRLPITMRAPTVTIGGAGEFVAAAQLRAAGKSLGIVSRPAVSQRGKNIATADLVAEEMRRGRHHGRVGGFGCHPVDARKMEAADAAGLVTAEKAIPAAMIKMAANWVPVGVSPSADIAISTVAIGTHGMNSDAACDPSCRTI